MFFKTDTEKSTVLKQAGDDAKKLRNLEAELASLRPEWERLQAEAEICAARYDGADRTFNSAMYEVFWQEHTAQLKSRIAELVAERDSLVAGVLGEIRALREKMNRRVSILGGGFQSWVGQIQPQLTGPLAAEIAKARAEVGQMQDCAEIIGAIELWADRISGIDDCAASIPVVNVPRLLKQAAGVE